MHEIKSFKVWQTAIILAVLEGILFWIEGIFVAIAYLRHGQPMQALGFFVGLPILVTILTFIGVAFLCWLYNQVAPRIGGIAFELIPRGEN
jgi:hypothetical protein